MKDKIKKTTLTTLSGAIVVSTMPLNVFADALNEELGSGIVTQETANLIAPDNEENQLLEITTEDVIEAEGTKETEVENIPVESEEIELEVEEPLELDILDSEGDVHEEIEEPNESEEAVLEEVAVNEEVNNELQQNGSSESERSVDKTQTVIDIPDTNLEDAIRQELNKPTGDITQADMESLMVLDAFAFGIKDLTGLEYAVNLCGLYLPYNQIDDISILSGLTKLEDLELGNNQISDISALSGLTKLEDLYLDNNQISDISALSGLVNLKNLWLGSNQISDISALSGLTKLQELYLSSNQISDISALSGLVNLKNLWLENNQISDISALSGLTKLMYLDISNNQTTGKHLEETLSQLPNISGLRVSFDKEPDLSSLQNLGLLLISNSVISDFSKLQLGNNLWELELVDCDVKDWKSINELTSLEDLYITGIETIDYGIFEELPNLGYVELHNNNILDLSQLSDLQKNIDVYVFDQHTKLDVTLVDNKLENPFIDLDGSYITTIELPNGVTLSDDGAYLIFDNPAIGDAYEFTAKSYQAGNLSYFGNYTKLKATFTITASKKTGGELTVEENTLSNFDKELQIEIKDAAYEIEKIILPDGTEVQGNTATYTVKESGDYTFKYVDVKGNEFTQTITVKVDKPVIDKPSADDSDANKPATSTNQAPIITASNVSIPVGYNLDLMSLATATDKEDGDLAVKITSSNFDNTKPGVYNVTYQATDSKGLSTTKTIHIAVRDLSEDENSYTKDIVIVPNEELDIESIVNEIAKDKGLTDVEILENNVNTSKPGDYSVVFEGTNVQKEQEIHSIKVTVMIEASSDKEDDHSSTSKPSGESVETGLTSGATITLGGLFTLAGIPFLKRKRK